jgi:hypothetical protein
MTITANYIISEVWELANMDPRKTAGKTGSQKRAFRLLLTIRGGVGFIACRPEAELAELGRRGICSANLSMILRKMAGVELQWRRSLVDVSGFEAQMRRLMREAARPGDSVTSESGTEEPRVPKTRREWGV